MKFIIKLIYLCIFTIAYSVPSDLVTEFAPLSVEDAEGFIEKFGHSWSSYLEFTKNTFIPIFGKAPFQDKSFQMGQNQWSWNLHGKTYQITFNSNHSAPQIEYKDDVYSLSLPKNLFLETISSHLKTFFLNTGFHPSQHIYDASILETDTYIKKFANSNENSVLIVEPSLNAQDALILKTLSQLVQNSEDKILILAHHTQVVEALHAEFLKAHPDMANRVHLNIGKSEDVASEISDETRIVFAPSISWMSEAHALFDPKTILFAEAHYAGGDKLFPYIQEFLNRSTENKIVGITATPFSPKKGRFLKLFSKLFLTHYGEVESENLSAALMEQIVADTQKGNRFSVEDIHYFSVEVDGDEKDPIKLLRIQDTETQTLILNPKYYPAIMDKLEPFLEGHQNGVLTVSTIKEAGILVEELRKRFPEKTFEAYTTSTIPSEKKAILKRFESGETKFLVTIRSQEIPSSFSLLIELAPSVSPKVTLDRLRALSEAYPAKDPNITWVRLSEYSVEELISSIKDSTVIPKEISKGSVKLTRDKESYRDFWDTVFRIDIKTKKFLSTQKSKSTTLADDEEITRKKQFNLKIQFIENILNTYTARGDFIRPIFISRNLLQMFTSPEDNRETPNYIQHIENHNKIKSVVLNYFQDIEIYEHFNRKYGTAFVFKFLSCFTFDEFYKLIDIMYYCIQRKDQNSNIRLKNTLRTVWEYMNRSEESFKRVHKYLNVKENNKNNEGSLLWTFIIQSNPNNKKSNSSNWKKDIDTVVKIWKAPRSKNDTVAYRNDLYIFDIKARVLASPEQMKYFRESYPKDIEPFCEVILNKTTIHCDKDIVFIKPKK